MCETQKIGELLDGLWSNYDIECLAMDSYYENGVDEDMRVTVEMIQVFKKAVSQVSDKLGNGEFVSLIYRDEDGVYLMQIENNLEKTIRTVPVYTSELKEDEANHGYYDEVKIQCLDCGTIHVNKVYFDLEGSKYPDDMYAECLHCKNWEEGSFLGNFNVLETYNRVENKQKEERHLVAV